MDEIIAKDTASLGAKYNKNTKSVDFKLYSKNAQKVFLCIFEKAIGEEAIMTLEMKKTTGDIWETSIKDYILNCHEKPVLYGFRVFGANWQYKESFVL